MPSEVTDRLMVHLRGYAPDGLPVYGENTFVYISEERPCYEYRNQLNGTIHLFYMTETGGYMQKLVEEEVAILINLLLEKP